MTIIYTVMHAASVYNMVQEESLRGGGGRLPLLAIERSGSM